MSNSYKVYASKEYVDGLRPTINSLSSRFAESASDTLTWDGDTTGCEEYSTNINSKYYKISDVILTADELNATTLRVTLNNGSEILFNESTGTGSGKVAIDYTEDGVVVGAFTYSQESQFDVLCIYNKEGYNGVYFGDSINIYDERSYTTSFTVEGYTGFTTMKLKEECLPEHTHDNVVAQPDWEENDETAAGYIKNRPFYNDIIFTTICSINVAPNDMTSNYYYGLGLGDYGDVVQIDDAAASILVLDTVLTVVFNGVEFVCTCMEDGDNPEVPIYLGNASLYDSSLSNTGEPFCIAVPSSEKSNLNLYVTVQDNSIANNTIELKTFRNGYKTIDDKYISDNIARVSDVPMIDNTLNKAECAAPANAVMSKTNPTGIGSFSLNRKLNSDIGDYSHAEGYKSSAAGLYSHAEGYETNAGGDGAHAEGYESSAVGLYSHAEGWGGHASSTSSHVEGSHTSATAIAAHAEGAYSLAKGDYSHAEGYHTTAAGLYSHAEGYETNASGEMSHVEGKYNIIDTEDKYIHIVGNGSDGDTIVRSNAHTLDWGGNAWFSGDVYVGSASGTNKDEGSKILATQEYVDNNIANLQISANYTYGIEDLTAGTSPLETDSLYFVYE